MPVMMLLVPANRLKVGLAEIVEQRRHLFHDTALERPLRLGTIVGFPTPIRILRGHRVSALSARNAYRSRHGFWLTSAATLAVELFHKVFRVVPRFASSRHNTPPDCAKSRRMSFGS